MSEGSAPMPARERAALILACLTLQMVVLFTAPLLFSNDGPQHLLSAYMYAHPEQAVADWVIVHPATDNGYRQIFWLVEPVFGWRQAHTVAVWAPLCIGLLGWLWLATEARRGALIKAALLTGVSIPWHYWIGLLPFLYSSAFVPCVYLLIRRGSRVGLLAAAAAMMVQAMCHPFPVMVSGAVFFVTRSSLRSAAAVAAAGLPAAFVALTVAMGTIQTEAGGVIWELEPDVFRQVFSQYIPGPQVFRVAFSVALVLLVTMCWRGRASLGREQRALAVVAVLLVLVTPMLPFSANGWELVRARLLPTAVPFLVVVSPLAFPPLMTSIVSAFSIAYALAALAWVHTAARELEHAYGDIYEGVARVMPELPGKVWQLDVYDTAVVPEAVPEIDSYGGTAHMAQVLAVTKLGQPNFTQATDPVLHGLLYRKRLALRLGQGEQGLGDFVSFWGRLRDEPERRRVELASYAAHAYPAEVLVAVGLKSDEDALRAAGFVVRQLGTTDAGMSIYEAHFVGCSVDLAFDAAVGDVVEIGVLPQGGAVEVVPVRAGANVVRLERVPCGMWWLRGGAKVGHLALEHDVIEVLPTTDEVATGHPTALPDPVR